MKRYVILILFIAGLFAGGCASDKNRDPGPWEYKTVRLEGASMVEINSQLHQWNMEGWQLVDPNVSVRRGGMGFITVVPLKRLRQ